MAQTEDQKLGFSAAKLCSPSFVELVRSVTNYNPIIMIPL